MMDAVVQWFDTNAVPNQIQFFFTVVPQTESEHATKLVKRIDSPSFISMEDDLGIGVIGFPLIETVLHQFGTYLSVIVNFAIKSEPK